MEVALENPSSRLRGVQFEICDVDNYLSCAGCEVADRISGFTCSSHEKPNEPATQLIVFSFTRVIEKGTGPRSVSPAMFPARRRVANAGSSSQDDWRLLMKTSSPWKQRLRRGGSVLKIAGFPPTAVLICGAMRPANVLTAPVG